MRLEITKKEKIIFYARYFLLKTIFIWWEVRRPKFKLFLFEIYYSLSKFRQYFSLVTSPFDVDYVETRFGAFKIRPHTTDMANVSPAFERRDVDYLIALMKRLKSEGKRILVIDIGANIGTFSVISGAALMPYDRVHVVAFEPATPSLELLKENIRINGLDTVVEPSGLMVGAVDGVDVDFCFSPDASGASGMRFQDQSSGYTTCKVRSTTLDAYLMDRLMDFDAVIVKLDVEGAEVEVMRGAEGLMQSGKDIYLLVEDFLIEYNQKDSIISYLRNWKATLLCKLTPYNSWWHYKH